MERLQEQGIQVGALSNKPELFADLVYSYNVWSHISRYRTYHYQGPNPLQATEILAWMSLHEIPHSSLLLEHILILEDEFLKFVTDEISKNRGVSRTNSKV